MDEYMKKTDLKAPLCNIGSMYYLLSTSDIAKLEDITDERIYGTEKTSSDGVNFKILTWWNKYNINFIIKFAEAQGWSVTVEQK